jgi:hypothetical protein
MEAQQKELMKGEIRQQCEAALQHEEYVKRMKIEQAEVYRQMLMQQKEMDKRFKEAGG